MSWKSLLVLAAVVLLPQCALATVRGDVSKIPQEPSAYTIVCLPDNYASDPQSQGLLQSFATEPQLAGLRESTSVQLYTASDPDFKHRWAARLPEVTRDGKLALIVIQDDHVLFGTSANNWSQIVADAKTQNVCSKINRSNGTCRLFQRCQPQHCEPKHEEPKREEPKPLLRPILPAIIEKQETKVIEKAPEEAGAGLILALLATGAPLGMLIIGGGSYLVTRSIQENDEQV